MRIYNTLSRQVEPFHPARPPLATFYVCGVTPQDEPHLGHARCYLVWDVLKRHLTSRGFQVKHVQNFTDIDDKILKKAAEEGISPRQVAQRNIDRFFEVMDAIGILRADAYPLVTTSMPAIIRFIQDLVAQESAYITVSGDVYFAVRRDPAYGELSHRSLDDLLSGARVDVDESKRDPLDFALWKAAKPGEESWDSPWGKGRPGWHIECSAMVKETIGDTVDIHAGGLDLVFPHHENELAQSRAHNHQPLARYWMHNGFVTSGSEKMSKSLGNFDTLRSFLTQYDSDTLRFFLLQKHYRRPVEFSPEALEAATNGLGRLRRSLEAIAAHPDGHADPAPLIALWEEARARFGACLDDDLDTPGALAALFDMAAALHKHLDTPQADRQAVVADLRALVDRELGISLVAEGPAAHATGLADDLMALILDLRQKARQSKDWPTADLIRDRLAALGIQVVDRPEGSTWLRS